MVNKLMLLLCAFFPILTKSQHIPTWIVREEIIQQGIDYPDYVLSQYLLETGFGRYVFQENIFGFKSHKHIDFSNKKGGWRSCVAYYKRWYDGAKKRAKKKSFTGVIYYQWRAPNIHEYLLKVKFIYKRYVKRKKIQSVVGALSR